MTSIDTTVPLAVAVRLNIQAAVNERKNLDYKAILDRINADGKVTANELKAVQQAVAAEIEAGRIDAAHGKNIMGIIAGRLAEAGSAEDLATIRRTVGDLDTLSLTGEQLDAWIDRAKAVVDRGLLARETRLASADGTITTEELAQIWQKAIGRDGTVSEHDVRAIYRALDAMLENKRIDAGQHAALRGSMDAALASRAGRSDVSAGGKDYIKANNTAHLLGGLPTSAATWTSAIDMLEFATTDASASRKLSGATVVAFADMVSRMASPISDTVARAVASALDAAVSSGTITSNDAAAVAKLLDRRIGFERYGIGAPADFSLIAAAMTALQSPSTTPPALTTDGSTRLPVTLSGADVHDLVSRSRVEGA